MIFPVTEHFAKTDRHTSFYLACGAHEAPLIVFVHGWPELSLSWRHQLPCFAASAFAPSRPTCAATAARACYPRHEDYALEHAVADMLELLDALGREQAVWVGHDWGAPVVWSLASHHPERCRGGGQPVRAVLRRAASARRRCSRYVDRNVYPGPSTRSGSGTTTSTTKRASTRATRRIEADPRATVQGAVPQGQPGRARQAGAAGERAARRRLVRRPGPRARPAARPRRVDRGGSRRTTPSALQRNGFFGPDAWYMNARAQPAYARARAGRRPPRPAGAVPARRLRLHLRDRGLAAGRADAPRLRRPHRGDRARPATGWRRSARNRQRRHRALAGAEASEPLADLKCAVGGCVVAERVPEYAAPMKIVLVRHGRPDEGHAERPHDPPLADEGLRQAQAAAALLAHEGIDRIVTSPLLRAQQTAAPLPRVSAWRRKSSTAGPRRIATSTVIARSRR